MANLIIVKIGGNAIEQLSADFFQQVKNWQQAGQQVLIIHGGGPQISALAHQLQLPIVKKAGVRVTDAATLAATKLALLGESQPALLQKLSQAGISAVGLNAADQQLLTGNLVDWEHLGYVGQVTAVNELALTRLTSQQVGVLAPLALSATGQWLNVNADSAAAAVARLMQAKALYLLTDVPGVLQAGKVMQQLLQQQVTKLIASHVITAGMQPKLSAALAALAAGVQHVTITNQLTQPGTQLVKEAINQ